MDTLVTPSRTITIAGADYVLDGSFSTLRAVQQAFTQDIVQVLIGIMDMPLDKLADLIAIGSGQPSNGDIIGQAIIDDIGVMTTQYATLKTQLIAWLNIAITPKAEREKKSASMEEIVRKAQSLSLGATTKDSPLAPSDGSPPNSGEAISGS